MENTIPGTVFGACPVHPFAPEALDQQAFSPGRVRPRRKDGEGGNKLVFGVSR